jgi:rhamnose utilization protein RhaD (predicted bifunctional aldolase and dehydrogenase)/NAD(P)-dependent dehydrogenase (short-subunit alcohol dehydrogenase family)
LFRITAKESAMKSLWNQSEAALYAGDLAQRVYSSRLLGADQSLVLHGGGNTSVKLRERNVLGEEEDILYVKGSGWDLATIEAPGFAPCRMRHLLGLARLDSLSDTAMARELKSNMTNASAPAPSVEAILHAIIPARFVDHTHADAVVTVTNAPDGAARIRQIYGQQLIVVPYVMPGFLLARACAELLERELTPAMIGMVLLNHGLFSWGATARESYERHIMLVDLAERYLKEHGAWQLRYEAAAPDARPLRQDIAALRREISAVARAPMILSTHQDAQALSFARREDLAAISQQGPATPDHVIRTKRLPLLGRDVQAYQAAYEAFYNEYAPEFDQAATGGPALQMLDAAPRVVLDPQLGLITVGRSASDAAIAEDIYRHTIEIISRATLLGGFRALAARELFEVEYWDLEQAKLRKAGKPRLFAGEVALVTGAASGIGKACVESLLARGAAVVGLDINAEIRHLFERRDFLGLACDISDEQAVAEALESAVRRFGGLDMLLLNAGIFPSSKRIGQLGLDEWRRAMAVNLDANVAIMREAHPLLQLSPRGGRVLIIGSKNVPAPGPGAAAYSASKAALVQLARVAALEWGGDGIRVNVIHPNAVFDTGIWTDEVLKTRAASYGLTVEQYKTNNVLRVEVTSRDVAELAAEMCGPLFGKTTAAQVPIDGGNERVI